MIEAYTKNQSCATGSNVSFNNVTIEKGCTAVLQTPTTIALNKCGVYMVACDAYGAVSGSAAGTVALQLAKNGALQPQAISSASSAGTSDIAAISFQALVQVEQNNCKCNCCESPTILTIQNVGSPATLASANIVVTKIC